MKAVILAAGLGKRLRSEESDLPKCLREAGGKPLLSHVLDALKFIPPEDTILVVGYKKEAVMSRYLGFVFAIQERQLGTGHAVKCAMPAIDGYSGPVLIACGDMPLISSNTYNEIIGRHLAEGNDCTILSDLFSGDDVPAFGRIIRSEGKFSKIIEARDCSPEQLAVRELNAGIYVFDAVKLRFALDRLSDNNSQNEQYLTDVPQIIMSAGGKVGVLAKRLGVETMGVNTPQDLKAVEAVLTEI